MTTKIEIKQWEAIDKSKHINITVRRTDRGKFRNQSTNIMSFTDEEFELLKKKIKELM